MLDALKFAFEILIIGALAMPWMAVLCRMFPGRDAELRFDLAFIPAAVRNGVEIAVVLAFGYLLGSAISRFSRDFFNDEMWQPLPTEDVIRDNIYFDEYCRGPFFTYKYWAEPVHLQPLPHFCPPATKSFHELSGQISTDFDELVQEVFRLQDSALLLQGTEKVDRLKQYFDQINILRGAAFNGFILFSLALFGGIGDLKRRWATHPAIALVVYLPAVAAMAYALSSLWKHWYVNTGSRYSDPPLAEIVIFLLASIGLLVARKPEEAKPGTQMPYLRIATIALVMIVVSVGGWWWTEVMYDRQVIHSLAQIGETGVPEPAANETPGKDLNPSAPAGKPPAQTAPRSAGGLGQYPVAPPGR